MKKYYRLSSILISILFISSLASAQIDMELIAKTRPTNSFSLNILDQGSLFTVNYEKMFAVRPTSFFTIRGGLGFANGEVQFKNDPNTQQFISIPHHLTYNTGKKKHFLEIGIAGSYLTGKSTNQYLLGPILGYRLQPLESNKLNVRFFATVPFLKYTVDIIYTPVGFSVGYCF